MCLYTIMYIITISLCVIVCVCVSVCILLYITPSHYIIPYLYIPLGSRHRPSLPRQRARVGVPLAELRTQASLGSAEAAGP